VSQSLALVNYLQPKKSVCVFADQIYLTAVTNLLHQIKVYFVQTFKGTFIQRLAFYLLWEKWSATLRHVVILLRASRTLFL